MLQLALTGMMLGCSARLQACLCFWPELCKQGVHDLLMHKLLLSALLCCEMSCKLHLSICPGKGPAESMGLIVHHVADKVHSGCIHHAVHAFVVQLCCVDAKLVAAVNRLAYIVM